MAGSAFAHRTVPAMPRAHPLVRQVPVLLNLHKVSVSEACAQVPMSRVTYQQWGRETSPTLVNFEALLNVLGYRLKIVPIDEDSIEVTFPYLNAGQNALVYALRRHRKLSQEQVKGETGLAFASARSYCALLRTRALLEKALGEPVHYSDDTVWLGVKDDGGLNEATSNGA